jgi:hypothetical protein
MPKPKKARLLTRREFARELDVPFSLVQRMIQRKAITPTIGLIPGRVPRIDMRLFLAEYGTHGR